MFSNPEGPQNRKEIVNFAPEDTPIPNEEYVRRWAEMPQEVRDDIINLSNFISSVEIVDTNEMIRIFKKMSAKGKAEIIACKMLSEFKGTGTELVEIIKKAENAKNN